MIEENKIEFARMYEIAISSYEKPVVGTSALATCTGVLLYSEKFKKAIVAHVGTKWYEMSVQIMQVVLDNKLEEASIKYLIIPGFYEEHYNVKEGLENIFKSFDQFFIPFDKTEIPEDAILKHPELPVHQFAFDASNGEFVSKKVDFDSVCKNNESNKKL